MLKNLRKNKKGFTLIELIIVIAILAILAAVAIPRLGSMTGKAKQSADVASAKSIANAVSIIIAEDGEPAAFTKTELKKGSTNAFVDKVADYLQSVPQSKTNNTPFSIVVDGDKIEVYAGDTKFFPEEVVEEDANE